MIKVNKIIIRTSTESIPKRSSCEVIRQINDDYPYIVRYKDIEIPISKEEYKIYFNWGRQILPSSFFLHIDFLFRID